MRPDRPSATAAWVAGCRGLGALLPEEARLCDDPFGLLFGEGVSASFARLLAASRGAAARAMVGAGLIAPWVLHMQVRTRVLDDWLLDFVKEGGRQVVVLGAGFDCRAQRFAKELGGSTVFEVDHPATQAKKRAVLDRAGATSERVRYVAWDFERQPLDALGATLAERGHAPQRPTFVLWEGVTMYLRDATIDATVRAVEGLSAPGSALAMTYIDRSEIFSPRPSRRIVGAVVARLGEPFRFGWDPRELPGWLLERGFALDTDVHEEEAARRLLPDPWPARARATSRFALARAMNGLARTAHM